MLALPTKGVARSVREHNSDLTLFCDWLEGCVLFDATEASHSDIVDALLEGKIYEAQDFAREMVMNAFAELRRRNASIGSRAPWRIEGSRIIRTIDWQADPAYSFCLALGLAAGFPAWAASFGRDYTEQGELFELLAMEAFEAYGWLVRRTGWGTTSRSKINQVVADIADWLQEPAGAVRRWTKADANEAGLDLVCREPFADNRAARPVYLVQCASGVRWESKQLTPELDVWMKLLDFTVDPRRAFAMPFALDDDRFRIAARRTNGLFVDRNRLLGAPPGDRGWVSEGLEARIVTWLTPRLKSLPRDT